MTKSTSCSPCSSTELINITKFASQLHIYIFFGRPFLVIYLSIFIYLFLAVLGFCCCAQDFSSCGKQGLLFAAVRGLLIVVASPVVEHGL